MDVKLMKDFEEMEGSLDGPSNSSDVVEEDDDDEDFRPAQAASLNSADIFYEMEKRGLKSTGFPDTDIEMLQNAFNEEFTRDLEAIRAQRRESKRRAAQQAGMQRRRMIMQQTLQEEQDGSMGAKHKTYLEGRLKLLESGGSVVKGGAQAGNQRKWEARNESAGYNMGGDFANKRARYE